MMNNLTKQIYKIYNSWRKFAIWFFCFVFTIATIKVYINNFLWIQESLYEIDTQILNIKQKISYYKTYKIPYINSDLAIKFLKHQNWLPQDSTELIIKIQKSDQTLDQNLWSKSDSEPKPEDIIINNWQNFWIYKIKKWI